MDAFVDEIELDEDENFYICQVLLRLHNKIENGEELHLTREQRVFLSQGLEELKSAVRPESVETIEKIDKLNERLVG